MSSARRAWLVAWVGGAVIGVANGAARELTYGKLLGERRADQVSVLTLVGAFACYFSVLQGRRPLSGTREAIEVGVAWTALSVGFEFGFGRLVAKDSWEELLAAYDLSEGRLWPLVLVWIAAGPEVIRRLSRAVPQPRFAVIDCS